jgi:hypothetical protein
MTAAPCILGIDPGISGAIAFFFPVAPDRVAAEDMPVVAGEVDCATLHGACQNRQAKRLCQGSRLGRA